MLVATTLWGLSYYAIHADGAQIRGSPALAHLAVGSVRDPKKEALAIARSGENTDVYLGARR